LSALCWRPRWRPRPPPPRVRRVVAPTTRLSVCGRWCLYPPAKRPTHGLSHLLAMAVRVFGHQDRFAAVGGASSPRSAHPIKSSYSSAFQYFTPGHLSSPPGSRVLAVCNQNERVQSPSGPESTASTRTPASLPQANSRVRGVRSGGPIRYRLVLGSPALALVLRVALLSTTRAPPEVLKTSLLARRCRPIKYPLRATFGFLGGNANLQSWAPGAETHVGNEPQDEIALEDYL
jgi:hypothetical protein